jgi:hypothetical protein
MVVSDGLTAPGPVVQRGWRLLALRALGAAGATILLVGFVAISVTGLLLAAADLIGLPAGIVTGIYWLCALASSAAGMVVFARIWRIEAQLDNGLATAFASPDD